MEEKVTRMSHKLHKEKSHRNNVTNYTDALPINLK
jgi:hypothetical protein